MRWDPRSQRYGDLTDRLRRPDVAARIMAEFLVTKAENIKNLPSHWTGSETANATLFDPDTPCASDFRTFTTGRLELCPVQVAMFSEKTGSATDVSDLDDAFPLFGLAYDLDEIVADAARLTSFTAKLNRRVDGGQPQFNGTWALQIKTVTETRISGDDFLPVQMRLTDLLSPAASVAADDMATDEEEVTFDLNPFGLRIEQLRETVIGGDLAAAIGNRSHRFLFFIITALPTRDDELGVVGTDNVAWVGDTLKSDRIATTEGELWSVRFPTRNDDGWWAVPSRLSSTLPDQMLYGELERDQYPDPAGGFKIIRVGVDLGAAAQEDVQVEFEDSDPEGTESVAELSNDGGTGWTQVFDGDVLGVDNTPSGGADLSAVGYVDGQMKMRWKAKADTNRTTSPALFRLGLRDRDVVDVSELVSVRNFSNWSIDPVTLQPAVGEVVVEVIRDGLRDFQDLATRLVTENEFADIELRLYVGHPDLDRQKWGLIEVLRVDDRKPLATAEQFRAVSVLEQMKGLIPPVSEVSDSREPVIYEDQSVKAVLDDIVDTQISLPSRYRGPLSENATDLLSRTLGEEDGLEAARQVAYTDGLGLIASQGRVKAVNFHQNDVPVRVFAREEVEMLDFDPGFRRRQPEMFVRFGFGFREEGEFAGEARSFNTLAFTRLGRARIEEEPLRPPEGVERWLPVTTIGTPLQSSLANAIGQRITRFIATGLMMATVKTVYAEPQLETGDMVAFLQDKLTARDPITGRAISGPSWVVGKVAEQYDVMGHGFAVWIRGYSNIIPGSVPFDRIGFGEPVVWAEQSAEPAQPSNAKFDLQAWPSFGTDVYWIYQALGATVPERSPTGAGGWTLAAPGDTLTLARDATNAKKLSVYGVRKGTMGPISTIQVRPDLRAQILSTTVVQTGDGSVGAARVQRCADRDQQTVTIRVYRRRGSWPTVDGNQASAVDPIYSRGTIDGSDGYCFTSGNYSTGDVIHDVWIPVNAQGAPGPRLEATYTVVASDPNSPQFVEGPTKRVEVQGGTSCADGSRRQVRLEWDTVNATDVDHDVVVRRGVNGLTPVTVATITDPVTTTQYLDELDFYEGTAGMDEQKVVDYVLELKESTTVKDQVALDEQQFFFGIDCP